MLLCICASMQYIWDLTRAQFSSQNKWKLRLIERNTVIDRCSDGVRIINIKPYTSALGVVLLSGST